MRTEHIPPYTDDDLALDLAVSQLQIFSLSRAMCGIFGYCSYLKEKVRSISRIGAGQRALLQSYTCISLVGNVYGMLRTCP